MQQESTGVADDAYPSLNVLAAVVLTVVAPFISLLAALVLRSEQRNPTRRRQLRDWAIGSAVWLGLGGVVFIAVAASILGSGSPSACKGGIDRLVPPSYTSMDGKHWTAEFTCMNGGTLTRPAQAGWLNQ